MCVAGDLNRVYTSATCCAATCCAQHVTLLVARNMLLVAINKMLPFINIHELLKTSSAVIQATCCGQQATCCRQQTTCCPQHVARPRNLMPRNCATCCAGVNAALGYTMKLILRAQ